MPVFDMQVVIEGGESKTKVRMIMERNTMNEANDDAKATIEKMVKKDGDNKMVTVKSSKQIKPLMVAQSGQKIQLLGFDEGTIE